MGPASSTKVSFIIPLSGVRCTEVRVGDGPWQEARLLGERKRHSWQGWELIARLEHLGSTVISARATDMANRTQPASAEWNRLGYGNNVIQQVRVDIR